MKKLFSVEKILALDFKSLALANMKQTIFVIISALELIPDRSSLKKIFFARQLNPNTTSVGIFLKISLL